MKNLSLLALLCVLGLAYSAISKTQGAPERKLFDFENENELDEADSAAIENAVQRLSNLVERVALLKQKVTKDLQSTSSSLQAHFARQQNSNKGGKKEEKSEESKSERRLLSSPQLHNFGGLNENDAAALKSVTFTKNRN